MYEGLYRLICIEYSTTIITLWCAICYVYYGVLSNKYRQWNNAFLTDQNLPLALFIPIAWQVQVCVRSYIFYTQYHYHHYTLVGLVWEFGAEFIDSVATVATTILFTGYYKK